MLPDCNHDATYRHEGLQLNLVLHLQLEHKRATPRNLKVVNFAKRLLKMRLDGMLFKLAQH